MNDSKSVPLIELSVIVPCFNERDNIAPLLDLLDQALRGIRWEAIFVDDDSLDGTGEILMEKSQNDARIRVIERVGRRGLASAVVEGMLATSAPYLAVIDADMQHDERQLVPMLEALRADKADIAIGSRYTEGGGTGNWTAGRLWISRFATHLSRLISRQHLTDPMSGFFMITRNAFRSAMRNLSAEGYKILLDIIASSPKPLRIAEIPYTFKMRQFGESKLDTAILIEYILLILDKLVHGLIPPRFILFSMIGLLGVGVQIGSMYLLHRILGSDFSTAQTASTIIAMVSNYSLNNALTYRDRRLKGLNWIRGLLIFCLICSAGIVGNVSIATFMFEEAFTWWFASLCGAFISAVWNYAVTSIYTWKRSR